MVALIEAAQSGGIPHSEVAVVISDQPSAAGLIKANDCGIETVIVERRGRSREEHDREIVAALRERHIDLVCLAGYMRILSPDFIDQYRDRILNIHPSLLPSFSGLDAQKQALDHGVKIAGCTVHFVDETLDGGPIVAQCKVPVFENDTVATLSERILEQEHELYPEAVATVLARVQAAHPANP